jgi:hypothetical protein
MGYPVWEVFIFNTLHTLARPRCRAHNFYLHSSATLNRRGGWIVCLAVCQEEEEMGLV